MSDFDPSTGSGLDSLPEKYRHDEEIIRQTIEQIKKDFGSQLPELVFSENKTTLFDELVEQVTAALQAIKANSTAFQSLLYRVDIKESEVRKAQKVEELAAKIIQREFQKVLTRQYFAGK